MEEIKSQLRDLFRKVFGDESLELTEAMTAGDVPGWDSLNHISLIVAVEKKFKVSLTTKEVASLNNVGELMKLLERKTLHVV